MTVRDFGFSADSYISDAAPTTNYDSVRLVSFGYGTDAKSWFIYHALLRCDLSRLAGKTISAAEILIWGEGGSGASFTGAMHKIKNGTPNYGTDWTEAGVTWQKYDGTNSWGAQGGSYYTAADVPPEPSPYTWTQTVTTNAWFTIPDHANLRALVQDAIDNEAGIFSVLLKDSNEGIQSGGKVQNFSSDEVTLAGGKKPPILRLTYTPNDLSPGFKRDPIRNLLVTR